VVEAKKEAQKTTLCVSSEERRCGDGQDILTAVSDKGDRLYASP